MIRTLLTDLRALLRISRSSQKSSSQIRTSIWHLMAKQKFSLGLQCHLLVFIAPPVWLVAVYPYKRMNVVLPVAPAQEVHSLWASKLSGQAIYPGEGMRNWVFRVHNSWTRINQLYPPCPKFIDLLEVHKPVWSLYKISSHKFFFNSLIAHNLAIQPQLLPEKNYQTNSLIKLLIFYETCKPYFTHVTYSYFQWFTPFPLIILPISVILSHICPFSH